MDIYLTDLKSAFVISGLQTSKMLEQEGKTLSEALKRQESSISFKLAQQNVYSMRSTFTIASMRNFAVLHFNRYLILAPLISRTVKLSGCLRAWNSVLFSS